MKSRRTLQRRAAAASKAPMNFKKQRNKTTAQKALNINEVCQDYHCE